MQFMLIKRRPDPKTERSEVFACPVGAYRYHEDSPCLGPDDIKSATIPTTPMADSTTFVRNRLKQCEPRLITFTKKDVPRILARIAATEDEVRNELHDPKFLVYAESQERPHDKKNELRYRCYFVYSGSRGRCYVLAFNGGIKIITSWPLGRTTLRRYLKKTGQHKGEKRYG
jgi:hypothetical protein